MNSLSLMLSNSSTRMNLYLLTLGIAIVTSVLGFFGAVVIVLIVELSVSKFFNPANPQGS